MVWDGCYGQKWPDSVFQVHDSCPICFILIHNPERKQCGHVLHKRCLLQHLDIYNTSPICRTSLRDPKHHVEPQKNGKWLLERSIDRDQKRPDNINHVVSCLELFAKNSKDVWAFSEDDEEEIDEKVCGCRHFQPMPWEMYGRHKVKEGI
ncbi:hypothetical protein TNCV_339921 [Trichonephila clavipes]|nr:hypothetical protein TNCV_339921 [Trichonephila clavipes]